MSRLPMHPAFLLLALALLLAPQRATAQEERAIQVALFTPIQAFPESDAVRGLRLSLYGRNTNLTGVDIGFVPHLTGDLVGVQIGAVNWVEGDAEGVQIGGLGLDLANVVQGHLLGAQIGGIVNHAASGEGVQLGGVNHSRNFRGLQLSFVNYAERLHGVQIGIINIIRDGGVLPVMPLVNWSFDEGPM